MLEDPANPEIPESVELPVDGVLDLHSFRPADIQDLLCDYFQECLKRGIVDVRIIHGKGTGKLQRSVHAILRRQPDVASFRLAGEDGGGWGATLVHLISQTRGLP